MGCFLENEEYFPFFSTSCLSILLYGCESWVITQQLEQMLDSFATNCYRVMLSLKRSDRVSNSDIFKLVGMERLTSIIQRRQLQYVGHCVRKEKRDLINQYVLYYPRPSHGKPRAGRKHLTYPDYIGKLINSDSPPTVDEISVVARGGFRSIRRSSDHVYDDHERQNRPERQH